MIRRRTQFICLNLVASILVIAAGAYWLDVYLNKERTRQVKPRKAPVRLVEVQTVELTEQRPILHATGVVKAKNQVVLRSEVKGVVNYIAPNLYQGALVKKGDLMLRLSSEQYQWQVDEAKAQLAKLEAGHQIELGKRQAAQIEHELSGMNLAPQALAMLLREPQLNQIKADIAKANVVLERAKWQLKQTALYAPFDGMITERYVEIGSYLKDNANALALMSTDEFWVEAKVPVNALAWLSVPTQPNQDLGGCLGSSASVTTASGAQQSGCVVGMLPQLDNKLKTATVLVSVRDPLALKQPASSFAPLLVNDHVEVALVGHKTEAVKVARRHLNNNAFVWVMDGNDQLAKREVTVAFRDKAHVLVSDGLQAGERLVTTPLPGSVEGIALKVRGEPKKTRVAHDANAPAQPFSATLQGGKETGGAV